MIAPLFTFHWHRSRWPWNFEWPSMASLICVLKYVLRKVCFSLVCVFSDKPFRNLKNNTYTSFHRQKCSPGNLDSGDISFMRLFTGVALRWSVKGEHAFHSSHTCCSLRFIKQVIYKEYLNHCGCLKSQHIFNVKVPRWSVSLAEFLVKAR